MSDFQNRYNVNTINSKIVISIIRLVSPRTRITLLHPLINSWANSERIREDFLNFAKAFDKVSHVKFVSKLKLTESNYLLE